MKMYLRNDVAPTEALREHAFFQSREKLRDYRMIIITAIGVIFFLALPIASIYLGIYNYNDDLKGKLLTGALVGVGTLFVSLYIPLNEVNSAKHFVTLLILDKNGIPLLGSETRCDKFRTEEYLNEVGSLTLGADAPKNFKEQNELLCELITFKILTDIEKVTTRTISGKQRRTGDGSYRYRQDISVPYPLIDQEHMSTSKWKSIITENRFGATLGYNYDNTKIRMEFPPGVEVFGNKQRIVFSKKNYFYIEYKIETGMGAASPPRGIDVISADRFKETWGVIVTYNAHFDWLTSNSSKSKEYQKWAEWLFEQVKMRNEIDTV